MSSENVTVKDAVVGICEPVRRHRPDDGWRGVVAHDHPGVKAVLAVELGAGAEDVLTVEERDAGDRKRSTGHGRVFTVDGNGRAVLDRAVTSTVAAWVKRPSSGRSI